MSELVDNNHGLSCLFSVAETFRNAAELGMCTVHPNWLYDSIKASCLLDETNYYVFEEESLVDAGTLCILSCG